ncbi:MAG TPA: acyl-CoA desaturase [Mycobacteriales bacterium]|nr:acyl-CoA desaturase [Mycobacteriales bacterium]
MSTRTVTEDAPVAAERQSTRRAPGGDASGTLRTAAPVGMGESVGQPRVQRGITALIVFGPFAGVVVAAVALFGRGVSVLDLVLAVVFYAVTGHGLTAGFHRLLAHRAFTASRWVKVTLAVAGSMAFEGSVISWVANHRRHHANTDREGDPHSPYAYGATPWARTRGALHAHMGWLFQSQPAHDTHWAPDLLADRDLVMVTRLFPVLCVLSLGAPALIGWAVTGTLAGAVGGFVWGGLVRVFLLHHSTFAVNSACHIWGKRPFRTRDGDRATNFAPLAVLAMGENWHNLHHSSPTLARHGVDRGQLDSTARLIWVLEHFGAVSDVRWPDPAALDRRRLVPLG